MAVLKIKDGNNWVEITGLTGGQGSQGPAGADGSNGADGITPTVSITSITGGHNIAFSYGVDDSRNVDFDVMDGVDGADGNDGTNGTNGTNGTTPVRGTDYWTQADITVIEGDLQTYINTQLGVIENGTY